MISVICAVQCTFNHLFTGMGFINSSSFFFTNTYFSKNLIYRSQFFSSPSSYVSSLLQREYRPHRYLIPILLTIIKLVYRGDSWKVYGSGLFVDGLLIVHSVHVLLYSRLKSLW